jgi:hypothetical protein
MARMTRPQFTLRAMFLSVSYFAVAFGSHHLAGMLGGVGILFSILCPVFVGLAGGTLFNRPLLGAAVGLWIAIILLGLMLAWYSEVDRSGIKYLTTTVVPADRAG